MIIYGNCSICFLICAQGSVFKIIMRLVKVVSEMMTSGHLSGRSRHVIGVTTSTFLF